MANSEIINRFLNPMKLNLQKMELELNCPTCLKLLDMPIILPCGHIFCSHCITILTKNGCECASCKSSFLHQDLRPAGHMMSLINIYKGMTSAVASIFSSRESNNETLGKKMVISPSPVSGNNYVQETSQRESIHSMGRETLSEPQLKMPNNIENRDGEPNERATQESKRCIQSIGEEALTVRGEQCSPPSSGSIKDSDCDNSDNGNENVKRSLRTVKQKEVGGDQTVQLGTGKLKRQKLNRECDAGDTNGINTGILKTLNPDCEHNRKICSDANPLDTSRCLGANRIVECVFCHSFRTTEASGEMLHFLNGREVDVDQATQPNVFHVHRKCIEWAPQIYYSGDTIRNLEVELLRASKLKCNKCGLKGAALGCFLKSCRKSYHVPCAYEILECRWDCENYLVLCPAHSSHELPCDKSKTKSKNKATCSLDSSGPSEVLTCAITPQCGTSTVSFGWARDLVLCGSALSKEEKGILDKFARISEAVTTNLWEPNVTHVIASVDEHGGCSRTLKLLMSILTGKWVLTIEWVKACIESGHPVPEETYEVTHDVHGCYGGPKIGRVRTMQKAPKLLYGLSFYITDDFQQSDFKKYLEDLILTGGGILLNKIDLMNIQRGIAEELSPKVFIIYSIDPPLCSDPKDIDEVLKYRAEEAEALAADIGGRAIRHTLFLDNIAACCFEMS